MIIILNYDRYLKRRVSSEWDGGLALQKNEEAAHVSFLSNLKQQFELIAAIACGFLILSGWLAGKADLATLSVIFYLTAFVLGGFAKAKEGIEATISDKELNVEMLMILAALGSALIGYWAEGAILIFIFALMEPLKHTP